MMGMEQKDQKGVYGLTQVGDEETAAWSIFYLC
jgi:hypothetical protein